MTLRDLLWEFKFVNDELWKGDEEQFPAETAYLGAMASQITSLVFSSANHRYEQSLNIAPDVMKDLMSMSVVGALIGYSLGSLYKACRNHFSMRLEEPRMN